MKIVDLDKNAVESIVNLYAEDFSDGWNKEMLLSSFATGRFFCVGAYDGDRLIGVIAVTLSMDFADIESVVTKAEFRRKGVADELMAYAFKKVKETGVNKILLEVRAGNLPAIALYKKHGFDKISERKGYYADGENAIILQKEL